MSSQNETSSAEIHACKQVKPLSPQLMSPIMSEIMGRVVHRIKSGSIVVQK